MSSSADLVQRQLDAYNGQDIEAFMACYSENAQLAGLNGEVTQSGHDAIRARHLDLFAQHPENRAELVNRIDIATMVIDHERVARKPDGERFDVAAIYTIRDGKIARVDFVRGN
jgi:uncharacterized protein (TIGR02246 family)